METANTLTILCFTIVCSAAMVSRKFWIQIRMRWDSNSFFVFSSAFLLNLPNAVAAFTGGQTNILDSYGNVQVVYSPTIHNLQVIAGLGVFAVVLAKIAHSIHSRNPVSGYVWPLVVVCVISLFSNVENNLGFADLNQWTALLVLVACLVAAPTQGAASGAALFGAFYAVGSGLLVVINPMSALTACTRKCSPTGVVMPGLNGSENAFGLCAALAVPFVFVGLQGFAKYSFSLFLGYFAIASGSRSALLGLSALVILFIANRIPSQLLKRFATLGIVGILAIVGLALPFTTNDPEAFSTRGRVWEIGISYFTTSPLSGLGASAWAQLIQVGQIARSDAYSLHNIWLDTLFVSGAIGGSLLGLSLMLLILSRLKSESLPGLLIILIPVLAIGILERSISIYSSNWIGWVLPALLLYQSGRDAVEVNPIASISGTSATRI